MIPVPDLKSSEIVFGCNLGWVPKYEDIPEDHKRGYSSDPKVKKMNSLMNSWFFCGLKSLKLTPKKGVDEEKAKLAIHALMGSYEPKHEHKEAAVTYLLCEWFDDAEFEKADREA